MYLLLISIHTIFIITAHIFSYYILEGIFILLLLFFLLYFSPIFFLNKEIELKKFQLPSLSPQKSIAIPLILVYISLYFLIFALTGDIQKTLDLHLYILIGVHIIFFGYMMSFMWKQDIFFDITRFHLIFTYSTVIGASILGCFDTSYFSIPLFILAILDIILSIIVFSISREENPVLFQSFLTVLILTGYIFFFLITHTFSFPILIGFVGILSLGLFEIMPRYKFFSQFLEPSKIFTLFLVMIANILLIGWSFFDFLSLYFIIIILIFLFSVHIRYSNYISFGLAVFTLFFIYSKIFSGMMSATEIYSTLLFIFFLPLLIIGNTYFWKERFPYDFSVLHYSSIAFSTVFSIYAIVFIGWGPLLFYVISACIFFTGILFLLSYFRFRYR